MWNHESLLRGENHDSGLNHGLEFYAEAMMLQEGRLDCSTALSMTTREKAETCPLSRVAGNILAMIGKSTPSRQTQNFSPKDLDGNTSRGARADFTPVVRGGA